MKTAVIMADKCNEGRGMQGHHAGADGISTVPSEGWVICEMNENINANRTIAKKYRFTTYSAQRKQSNPKVRIVVDNNAVWYIIEIIDKIWHDRVSTDMKKENRENA